jgi:hypothetical protein
MVVAVAAIGAVLAGGTGYAALRGLGLDGGTTHNDAQLPLVTLAPPSSDDLPDDSPSITIPASASASLRKSASASASASPTASPTQTTTTGGSASSAANPTPTPTATRSSGPLAATPSPPPTTSDTAALTADFRTQLGDNSGDIVTVTVTNPGKTAVDDWTVGITVPGADQVVVLSGGVTFRLNGDDLTFAPGSGTSPVAAGGSVTFSFAVAGSPTGSPTGCVINGNACS